MSKEIKQIMSEKIEKAKAQKVFNPEEFKVKYRAFLSFVAFVAGMIFLFVVVLNDAAQTSKYGEYIIGWMTGTLMTLVFTFYFGSSDNGGPTRENPAPTKPEIIQDTPPDEKPDK